MSVFSTAAKEAMLDALGPDAIQLHDGDPGSAGTDNVISDTKQAAAWDAASSGERALSEPEEYTGLTPAQSITWVSVWDDTVFLGKGQLTGDLAANANGDFTVNTCPLKLDDPS